MFTTKIILGVFGMLGSTYTLGLQQVTENGWLQGGALGSFIVFLLWVIKTLVKELKTRDKREKSLQDEVRKLMRETIEKSNDTIDRLAKELKTRREERNSK